MRLLISLAVLLSTASAAFLASVPAQRADASIQHRPATIIMKDMSPTMRMLRERLAVCHKPVPLAHGSPCDGIAAEAC